jgi:hypothetical protein
MKDLLLGMAALGVASFLGGCPIYSGSEQHAANPVCDGTRCYSCPDPTLSPACVPWTCASDADCRDGYRCGYDPHYGGTCVAAASGTSIPPACASPADCLAGYTCGQDGACHPGDCSGPGCPSGYQCTLTGGHAQCVAMSAGTPSSNTDAGQADAGTPPAEGGSGDAAAGMAFDSRIGSDGIAAADGAPAMDGP